MASHQDVLQHPRQTRTAAMSTQPDAGDFGFEHGVSTSLLRTNLELGRFDAVKADLARLPVGRFFEDLELFTINAQFLQRSNRFQELDEFCGRALNEENKPPRFRATAYLHWSGNALNVGAYTDVADSLTRFIHATRIQEVGHDLYVRLLGNLGMAWLRLREFELCRQAFQNALAVAERGGNREVVSEALGYLGLVERTTLDWENAESLLVEAARIQSEEGASRREVTTLINLAALRLIRGRFALAINTARRAAILAEELSESRRAGLAQILIGWSALRLGNHKTATSQLLRVRRGAAARGDLRTFALTHEYLGELALREGRLEAARRWLQRAYRLVESVPERDIMGEAQCRLAEVELHSGNVERALELVATALAAFEEMNDRYEMYVCKRVYGQVLLTMERRDDAIGELDEALAFFQHVDERFESHRVIRLLDAARSGGRAQDVDLINLPLDDSAFGSAEKV